MAKPKQIHTVVAILAEEPDGTEIIPYIIQQDGAAVPLVASADDPVAVDAIKHQGKWFAKTMKRPARLVMFSDRKVLEGYSPPPVKGK